MMGGSPDLEPVPVIVELVVTPTRLVSRGRRYRAWLISAGLVVCVAVGAVGHVLHPSTASRGGTASSLTSLANEGQDSESVATRAELTAGPPSAIDVTSPGDGVTVHGSMIDVVGTTSRDLDSALIAIRIGDAVVGWTTRQAVAAGRFQVTVPVFAPSTRLPATVVIASRDRGQVIESRRDIVLAGEGPIAIWTVKRGDDDSGSIEVRGSAPLAGGPVEVTILDDVGRTVASGTAAVEVDQWQRGAEGGRILGLGFFRARLKLDGDGSIRPAIALVMARDGSRTSRPIGATHWPVRPSLIPR